MLDSIRDPEIRKLLEDYVESYIDHIAERTYASLVMVDGSTDFKLLRSRIKHSFERSYNLVWGAVTMKGDNLCEGEIARDLLILLEKNALFYYAQGISMPVQ